MKFEQIYNKIVTESVINDMYWYHGTKKEFTEFDLSYFGETDGGWWGYGIYFHSEGKSDAYGKIIKQVKLNFKNPIILSNQNWADFIIKKLSTVIDIPENFKEMSVMNIIKTLGSKNFTNYMVKLGHDAMIMDYINQGTKECVVFDDSIITITNQNINQ